MQKQNWIYAFASAIGNGHITQNIPCQDFCTVEDYEDFIIAVVADGAGSCANSDKGSKQVCQSALIHFYSEISKQEWFMTKELPNVDIWHSFAKKLLLLVRTDLEHYSVNNEFPFKSLSSTIIVAIAFANGLLVTHIGDGRAGYCNSNDEWFSMITPFKGQEANETVFITSDIWYDEIIDTYVESRVIYENVKAFCLLSDGCEKASFECNIFDTNKEIYYDPNIPFKDFFHKNVNVHLPKMYNEGKNKEEINELWKMFLTSGNPKLKNESDDKSMILAVKNIC